jgi:hypothetical protein
MRKMMAIVRGLTTLAKVKLSLGITASTYDTDLEDYISAATPFIEGMGGPMFAESRTLTFDGGYPEVTLPFKFNAVTSVTVEGSIVTGYVANGAQGIISAGTGDFDIFYRGIRNVVVVVTVGFATIPPNVELAARELVRLWWQTGRQANRPGTADQGGPGEITMGLRKRITELLDVNDDIPGFA